MDNLIRALKFVWNTIVLVINIVMAYISDRFFPKQQQDEMASNDIIFDDKGDEMVFWDVLASPITNTLDDSAKSSVIINQTTNDISTIKPYYVMRRSMTYTVYLSNMAPDIPENNVYETEKIDQIEKYRNGDVVAVCAVLNTPIGLLRVITKAMYDILPIEEMKEYFSVNTYLYVNRRIEKTKSIKYKMPMIGDDVELRTLFNTKHTGVLVLTKIVQVVSTFVVHSGRSLKQPVSILMITPYMHDVIYIGAITEVRGYPYIVTSYIPIAETGFCYVFASSIILNTYIIKHTFANAVSFTSVGKQK